MERLPERIAGQTDSVFKVRRDVSNSRRDRCDRGRPQQGGKERKQEERLQVAQACDEHGGPTGQRGGDRVAAERRDRVKNPDEERNCVGGAASIAAGSLPEAPRKRLPLRQI